MVQFLVTHAALGITLISFFTSLAIAGVYKMMVDQNAMRRMKEEVKELRTKLTEAQKSNDTKDFKKYQSRMLSLSHEQMRLSMKPMFATFIIAAPVFVWMLPALYQIAPVQLAEDGSGTFAYQGVEAALALTVNSDPALMVGDANVKGETFGKEIKFDGVANVGAFTLQPVSYNKETRMLILKLIVVTSPLPIPFAGHHLGWLGWYILTSIPLGILTRKLLGVQ